MTKLVSIIIPIYNTESFLERCVQSVMQQTYEYLDILLIDDGSTDQSGSLCDKFAEHDTRIHVFHKKNGGLSDARNYGLEKAVGSYIFFLDSDDWIEPESIQVMVESAEQRGADIVSSGYRVVDQNGTITKKVFQPFGIYSAEEAMGVYLKGRAIHSIACAKLYKKELFRNVRFPVGFIHEDEFTTYKLIYASKKICTIEELLYNYFQRSDSITHARFDMKRLVRIDAARELYYETLKYDSEENCHLAYVRYVDALRAMYICGMKYLDQKQIGSLDSYKEEIYKECRRAYHSLHKTEICKKDLFLISYLPVYYKIYRILKQFVITFVRHI